jgi:hypothetical protein
MNARYLTQEKHMTENKEKPHHVNVAVVTTSGTWPHTGHESVAANQPVKNELHRAAKNLNITDTTGWIAQVGDKELNVERSYTENGLSGQVDINYGPRKGGGGNA